MSSPFQQGFMGKNPFRTAKRITDAVKAADTEFYKDIDPYEAEGNRMEAEEQSKPLPIDDKTSYDYDYDQNPETTASRGKKKSPLNSSPLNGAYQQGLGGAKYVSDLPAVQDLQSSIARNAAKLKGEKGMKEVEAELKEEDMITEDEALQNILTGDGVEGFADNEVDFEPPLNPEDIEEVYDPEDLDPYDLMPGAKDRELGESYSPPGLTNKKSLMERLQNKLRQDGIGLF
tara:strand:- start:104 stop:796 length:693 start_codon:yes stop_codon:yes gene_type:complete